MNKRTSRPTLCVPIELWRNDPGFKRCSLAARGLWADMLSLMELGAPYGHLAHEGRPLSVFDLGADLGRLPRSLLAPLQELIDADVPGLTWLDLPASRASSHQHLRAETFAGLQLPPGLDGSVNCLFSRNMVRQEHIRKARAAAGAKGGNPLLMNRRSTDTQTLARDDEKAVKRSRSRPVPAARSPAVPPATDRPVQAQIEPPSTAPVEKGGARCPQEAVLDLYEELLPMLPKVLRQAWKRGEGARALEKRWAEGYVSSPDREGALPAWMTYANEADGLAAWRAFFERVALSDLLTGKKGTWHADMRWLIKPSNFVKVLEGRYLDSQYTRRTPALDDFLAAYPRAGEDADSVALAWNTLGLESTAEAVMEGLAAWKASHAWQQDGGRYVPSASRWLRSRGFEVTPEARSAPNVHALGHRKASSGNAALWATPVEHSSDPNHTGDWRVIAFPGGYYFLSEDALVFSEQVQRSQGFLAPFFVHGRIAYMDTPPERVRLMVESYRRGQLIKPAVRLREEDLPAFPDDQVDAEESRSKSGCQS